FAAVIPRSATIIRSGATTRSSGATRGPARLADDVGRDPVGVALAGAVADRCAVPSEARSVTTAVTATPSVARQATPTATRVVAPCHQATASSPPVTTCSHPGHRDRVDGRTTAEQTCR